MNKIKIVKKDAVPAPKVKKRKLERPRDAAREMVATISDWVADLKERKRDETRAGLDFLNGPDTRPSEG
jgi:hypothetical protein